MRFFFLTLLILVVLTGGLYHQAKRFIASTSVESVTLDIDPGMTLRNISKTLEENKIVSNALYFEIFVRFLDKATHIKAGEYEFEKDKTPTQILDQLVMGRVKLYPITIPEGFNLQKIGARVIALDRSTLEEWEQLVTDTRRWIQIPPAGAKNLEGYLYPDTYLMTKKTTAEKLVDQMLGNFRIKVKPYLKTAEEKGFTLHAWVTLASIIEKETGIPEERPRIGAVFLNRLKKGMPLQTDPTVIYGIKNFDGNLTRAHLQTDHPYNTYTRADLPPGPICSPGLASLLAVLNPETSQDLYFVAKGDGTHQFSKTLEEHQRAVQHYQILRKP